MIGTQFLQHKPDYPTTSFSDLCQAFNATILKYSNLSRQEDKSGANHVNKAEPFNMPPPTHHGAGRCQPSLFHFLIVECRPRYRGQQAEPRFLCHGRAA